MKQRKIRYSEYKELLKIGNRVHVKGYFVCYMPFLKTVVKIGASRKVGGAVVRNRQKRIVRDLFRGSRFKENFLVLVVCLREDLGKGVGLVDRLVGELDFVLPDYKDTVFISH